MYDSKRQNWMALISDPLSFLSSSSSDPIRFCRASIRARLRSSNALLELSSSRSLTPRVAGSSVPLLCAFTATEIALTAINPTTLAGANSRKPVRKLAKMPMSCVTLPTIDGFSLRATSRHSRETHVMAFFYGFFCAETYRFDESLQSSLFFSDSRILESLRKDREFRRQRIRTQTFSVKCHARASPLRSSAGSSQPGKVNAQCRRPTKHPQ